ncbi:DUF222 domain-containing protein [Cellulomonas sp. APG4]|uniref:HNH endonuclease signature motif containing protein n=1 Tax=Cellulomonas sp. APG4 TaxID=1538656 RepID=UPI00137B61C0|nr:HNH endonuclease signature motif containing protein [Cellulomonas sp. APG4]NCT91276.1 DUF222 domain-containing protein [Cellulomonas sp. APG4]
MSDEPCTLVTELDSRARALAHASSAAVDGATAAALHARLRTVTDLLGTVMARLLARVEEDGRWAASGSARTFPEWVARQEGSSLAAARRSTALGKALDDALPATREALLAGTVSLEHAEVLAQVAPTSGRRLAALRGDDPRLNEAALLERARSTGVDRFRREARRWAAAVDAQEAEREHERAVAAEHLTFSPRDHGMALTGFLTHESSATLLTALRAVTGVPAADDERTHAQRDAAALTDLARLTLTRGLAGAGAQVRPQVMVHVDYPTFERLCERAGVADDGGAGTHGAAVSPPLPPATLDSGEPLPPSVLARLVCDSDVARVVFGPEGQVLDVGRAHRTFTGHLRRAVVARDRSCRYPGCGAPPHLGEIHHVRQWARDHGDTSVANGILLCWYHHDLVHRRGLHIAWEHGAWRLTRHDGTPIRDGTRAGERSNASARGSEEVPQPEPSPPDGSPPSEPRAAATPLRRPGPGGASPSAPVRQAPRRPPDARRRRVAWAHLDPALRIRVTAGAHRTPLPVERHGEPSRSPRARRSSRRSPWHSVPRGIARSSGAEAGELA